MKRLLTGLLATYSLAQAQEGRTAEEAGAVAFHSGAKRAHEANSARQHRSGRLPVFAPADAVRWAYLMNLREKLEKDNLYRIETSRVTVPDGQQCLLTYLLPEQPGARAFVSAIATCSKA